MKCWSWVTLLKFTLSRTVNFNNSGIDNNGIIAMWHSFAYFIFYRCEADSVFELTSMCIDVAIWYAKYAAKLAAKGE